MLIHKPVVPCHIESTIFDKIDGSDGTLHRDLCSNRHHHSSAINDTLTAHMEQNKHTAVTLSLANSGFVMKRKMENMILSDAKMPFTKIINCWADYINSASLTIELCFFCSHKKISASDFQKP